MGLHGRMNEVEWSSSRHGPIFMEVAFRDPDESIKFLENSKLPFPNLLMRLQHQTHGSRVQMWLMNKYSMYFKSYHETMIKVKFSSSNLFLCHICVLSLRFQKENCFWQPVQGQAFWPRFLKIFSKENLFWKPFWGQGLGLRFSKAFQKSFQEVFFLKSFQGQGFRLRFSKEIS